MHSIMTIWSSIARLPCVSPSACVFVQDPIVSPHSMRISPTGNRFFSSCFKCAKKLPFVRINSNTTRHTYHCAKVYLNGRVQDPIILPKCRHQPNNLGGNTVQKVIVNDSLNKTARNGRTANRPSGALEAFL